MTARRSERDNKWVAARSEAYRAVYNKVLVLWLPEPYIWRRICLHSLSLVNRSPNLCAAGRNKAGGIEQVRRPWARDSMVPGHKQVPGKGPGHRQVEQQHIRPVGNPPGRTRLRWECMQ
ncbi:hypothetical protein ACFL2Q_18950 [Thermodesulfobacteriota bacterium]